MTKSLEQSYRELLRWYPKAWRHENGEVLVGTLLDVAGAAGRTTLERRERRTLIAAGMRTRAEHLAPHRVRDVAATVALSMAVGSAVIMFLMSSWAPWGTTARMPYAFTSSPFGPFYDLGPLVTAFWIAALAAAIAGRWDIGRWFAAATIPIAALLPLLARAGGFLSPDGAVLTYSTVCALLAVSGTPRTRLPLLGAVTGWAAVVFTIYALTRYWSDIWSVFWEPTGVLWSLTVFPFLLSIAALGIALPLALARLRTAAFALLLAAAPAIITLAEIKATRTYGQMLEPWPLVVLLAVELALLSFLSRRRTRAVTAAPTSTA